MSHDQALDLQHRLEVVVDQFESELEKVEKITSREELNTLLDAAEALGTVLNEVKTYFIDVRNQLTNIHGIPPAKELAQLVIGSSTEALSSIRETLHYFEDLKEKLKVKRKTPITREEINYADFSARAAIRKSRYIINRISEQAEDLPEQL
ncbi:MAG: hypothetical protein ACFFD8_06885 [Candidatus Thorarchaeota archaeon]